MRSGAHRSTRTRVITGFVVVSVSVLALLAYRALYRSLEWYLWFGPQPFAGAETEYTVVLYGNRFTSESAAFLFGPDGEVVVERVMWVGPTPDGRVSIMDYTGQRKSIDDPAVFAAVTANSPNGFCYGMPIPDRLYQYWPRWSTDYDALPLPAE